MGYSRHFFAFSTTATLFQVQTISKFVTHDLFVENARKMDIRQFVKRKSISDSRSVKNISCKRLRVRFDRHRLMGYSPKGKAFCERPFALHCEQPEKDKQSFDIAPPGKIYVEAHGCTDFNQNF